MSVTIPVETERLLRAEEARTGVPAEVLLSRAVQAHFGIAENTVGEVELLRRAMESLDEAFWERFRVLAQRRSAGKLTEVERGELIAVVRQANAWNNRRLEAAIALAAFRGVPFHTVKRELGIEPVVVE